ncbi:MAG: hypothetical protein VX589_04305 [Myxococcota bacterium]|nr:hypothetical protein [Myxococcota bacterium]
MIELVTRKAPNDPTLPNIEEFQIARFSSDGQHISVGATDGRLASPDLGQIKAHYLNDDRFAFVVETALPVADTDRAR